MSKTEAPMKKPEAPMKKPEAKEEGAKSKHISVASDKREKLVAFVHKHKKPIIISSLVALGIFILCVLAIAVQLRIPQFILEDLYVDSVSNSSVMVKLSSRNPSSTSSVHYSKIRMRIWVEGNFETERVFLANTFQEPRSVLLWIAAVATNSDNARVSGSFQVRDGVTKGDVITEFSFQWKSGFFTSTKFSLRVTCPVMLNLKDLTSAVSKPMSSCSHKFT